MKRALSYAAGIIGLAIGLFAPIAFAATTAVGPYYANPSWDQQFPASTRFIVLSNWGSAAVLDRETGLVWERSPTMERFEWVGAQAHCIDLNAGGRTGWRLPAIQELMSLVDRSVSPGPTLPSGHPFTNVGPSAGILFYWSATTDTSTGAWAVNFDLGFSNRFQFKELNNVFVWCVRGGPGVDAQ